MDDILYSRTVQDCERFCDDVSWSPLSNKTEIKSQTEHQKVKSQIQINSKLQAADEKFAGESFQLQKFLSTGRSVLSEVKDNAKIIKQIS